MSKFCASQLLLSDSLYSMYLNETMGMKDTIHSPEFYKDSTNIKKDCLNLFIAGGNDRICDIIWNGKFNDENPTQVDFIIYFKPITGPQFKVWFLGYQHYDLSEVKSKAKGKKIIINIRAYKNKNFFKQILYKF